MTESQLKHIWEKTKGHCHFCGDPVMFEKRGWSSGDLTGYWEVDHLIQKGKGGSKMAENCLAACTRCNCLRWFRTGEEIRELLWLGLIAKDEVKKNSEIGKSLIVLSEKRLTKNKARRSVKNRILPEQT